MAAYPSWHIVQLTPEAALEHEMRVYNVGPGSDQPDVRLGWKPYTYRATKGAVSYWACHTEEELAVRLVRYGLAINGWSEWRDGVRSSSMQEV